MLILNKNIYVINPYFLNINMKKILIIFILSFVQTLYSQTTNTYHVVSSGETLSNIAQKYKITPYDIIKLNPTAVNGVKEKDVLIIPKTNVEAQPAATSSDVTTDKLALVKTARNSNRLIHVVQSKETKYGISKLYGITIPQLEEQNPQVVAGLQAGHKLQITGATTNYKQDLSQVKELVKFDSKISYVVLPKETLYGISKRNGISIEELVSANAFLKEGLKSGQKISIPVRKGVSNSSGVLANGSTTNYHLVEPKETKFGLSRKYGVTIEQLENLNPQIVKGLQIGQKIVVPSSYNGKDEVVQMVVPKDVKESTQIDKSVAVKTTVKFSNSTSTQEYVDYEVQPKETLFGLSKKAGMTLSDFTALNPKLANAVQIGMIIKMPKNASLTSNVPLVVSEKVKKEDNKKEKVVSVNEFKSNNRARDLSKTVDKSVKKQLALVLPFDDAQYQSYLKISSNFISVQDEFVKNDLQFYSGALAAIDSIKKITSNLDVKLVDLQKNDLSLDGFLRNETVMQSNAILMPFYDSTAANVALGLSNKNIPVITNQIVKEEKGYSNLYVAVPSDKEISETILDYLKSKEANIIVVNSNDRVESKKTISEKCPDAKFVKISDKDLVDTEDLKKLLIKNKLNYVVLDADKNSMIIGATNVLLSEFADFQIQIAVLEPSLLSNFENVSSIRTNILKMIYPSLTSVYNSSKLDKMTQKVTPNESNEGNQNFLLGFDMVYDTLLRLSQNKDFEVSAKEDITEYLKLQFKYSKNEVGTYVNKGFYILQHDTDEKIKELN